MSGYTPEQQQQRQQHYRKNIHRSLPRLAADKTVGAKLRKITLYRNGDRYFPGKQVTITPQNYAKLKHLLQELSNIVELPYGVRRLFTPVNGSEITDVNSLKDGASYICAAFEPFHKLDYTTMNLPCTTFNIAQIRQPLHDYHSPNKANARHLPSIPLAKVGANSGPGLTSNTGSINRFQANNIILQSLGSTTSNNLQQTKRFALKSNKYGVEPLQSKPRTITIVKYGNEKPHKTISILLNRRTGQTFDQLLSDISEAFGYTKGRNDRIRRMFTLRGRQLNGIMDFFREDDIFVASTTTNDIPLDDLHEINLEIHHDTQVLSSRRQQFKKQAQSPVDYDIITPVSLPPPFVSIDTKKTVNPRDSMAVDDEDAIVTKDNEVPVLRFRHYKGNEPISEDATTSNETSSRRPKKANKQSSITNIEQQRERERQRLREDDDRRKKLLSMKKDQQQQPVIITSMPKFEQLVLDVNDDDGLRAHKSKPIPPIASKPPSISPLPHSNVANPGESEVKLSVTAPKKHIIKKRSITVHPSGTVVSDKYEFGKKMGDGNFALVRRSKLRGSPREFAVKIIDKSKMKGKEYMLDQEINIMYQCSHANIVRLYEDFETPEEIYLVMELIKGGDLFDYITKHRRFDEPTSALMIKDVSEALLYLHTKRIVHRDLKPENLLVMHRKDGRITIKLTDFGLAMQVTGLIKTVCGTPTYVAPEILAEAGYGVEVDCWATGIILYILLCGYPPFKTPDRNQEELFQLIQRGKFNYEPDYWNAISTSAKDLIDHLLVVDRQKRLHADEILLHPWIVNAGQTKPTGNTEELKNILRLTYEAKIKEYAMEHTENQ